MNAFIILTPGPLESCMTPRSDQRTREPIQILSTNGVEACALFRAMSRPVTETAPCRPAAPLAIMERP